MNQNPGGIRAVMGISAEVIAAINDHAFPSGGGKTFRDDETGKAGADDQEIGGVICFQTAKIAGDLPITLPPLVDLSETE
ncbi:MAG: hypothetical protein V4689_14250 [Verrucomicrobiota bacterium]